jgi:hypothetical protein
MIIDMTTELADRNSFVSCFLLHYITQLDEAGTLKIGDSMRPEDKHHVYDVRLTINGIEVELSDYLERLKSYQQEWTQERATDLLQERINSIVDLLRGFEDKAVALLRGETLEKEEGLE